MDIDYFRDVETPRFARLGPNLVAAVFPLMKLMPARFILDRAERAGELSPGAHIVETTSGTFGMALALLAAARGYKLTLVTTKSLTDETFRSRLEQTGAVVIALDDPLGNGDQAGRLARLHQIISTEPNVFWTRQYANDGNWLAYSRLAKLFASAAGEIDFLVGATGTGGSLCGTGTALRKIFPHTRVVAVDTHRSVLFGQPAGRRMLRGLGNSILPENLRHQLIDEVHWVGAYPAYKHTRDMFREHGIFQGPTSGAAALVANFVAQERRDASVAVILPDEGHRYADTVYNDRWLASLPGWNAQRASSPVTLDKIAPAGEAEWTRFYWNRRTHAMVMDSQAGG